MVYSTPCLERLLILEKHELIAHILVYLNSVNVQDVCVCDLEIDIAKTLRSSDDILLILNLDSLPKHFKSFFFRLFFLQSIFIIISREN